MWRAKKYQISGGVKLRATALLAKSHMTFIDCNSKSTIKKQFKILHAL